MPVITENFLFLKFISGITRVDRHHNVGGDCSITQLFNQGNFTFPKYNVFCDPNQPQICDADNQEYKFTFISITNAADGNKIILKQNIPVSNIINIDVGTEAMVITKVYGDIPGYGSGGEPIVWLDAFDVDTGLFSDDDFVNIIDLDNAGNPVGVNAGKSSTANLYGYVSTEKKEVLDAYSEVDANKPFIYWLNTDTSAKYGDNHNLNIGESGIFIVASYQNPRVFCKPLLFCIAIDSRHCPPLVGPYCRISLCAKDLCPRSLEATASCPPQIDICMVINPRVIDWMEEVIRTLKYEDVVELAKKMDTAKVKVRLNKLPAAMKKSIIMMLKQIKSSYEK
jgi:hypothetical protein